MWSGSREGDVPVTNLKGMVTRSSSSDMVAVLFGGPESLSGEDEKCWIYRRFRLLKVPLDKMRSSTWAGIEVVGWKLSLGLGRCRRLRSKQAARGNTNSTYQQLHLRCLYCYLVKTTTISTIPCQSADSRNHAVDTLPSDQPAARPGPSEPGA